MTPKTYRYLNLVSGILLMLLATGASPQAEGQESLPATRAGFAETDITPEIGMEQPGGYGKSYHQSIHDPCKVRAAVFDDGTNRVAVVGLDALVIPAELVAASRERIEADCGLPGECVFIAASHSHSSGPLFGARPGEFDHASEQIRELAYNRSTAYDETYGEHVENQIVAAVTQAVASLEDVRFGAGCGIEDQVAFNRRFRMTNGLSYTHPRQGNPDIVETAGPTDPEVGVIGAWNADGDLTGCVVNFACHATTSPGGASANYIYYLEQAIRGMFGDEVVVVFLPGMSGDITQVDNLSPYRNPGGEEWARLVGGRVGAEAVKVLLSMAPGDMGSVGVASETLVFERRRPSDERLARSRELVAQEPSEVGATEWTFAKEIVLLDAMLEREETREAEVQAVQVGPVVLLGMPGEIFCQFGLTLKVESDFPLTFPVSFANANMGYIPTAEALGEHGGGYETRLTSYSNLAPDSGDRMVESLLKLTEEMTPSSLPTRAPAPNFTGPWGYGNVPPELE